MMLGIQIGTEYLDLSSNATLELERQNIFLQFAEELLGEYSFPFQVMATPKNLRLLNYAAIIEKRITNTGIDAIIFDSGVPQLRGKIKIEKPDINLNRVADGSISCYFLSGISSFFQDIKDKNLRAADYGGDRSFAWDSYGTDITTSGFWAKVRDCMYESPGYGVSGFDYAFFPVKNEGWPGNGAGADLMNKVYWNMPTSAEFFIPSYLGAALDFDRNRIVPFPYLKYVMERAAAYAGWKIEGELMNFLDFKKIVMINFRAIDWCYTKLVGGTPVEVFRDPVVFNLKDHLPDITISNFFLALKNRFGWWYDVDRASKIIHVRSLNEVASGEVKDVTLKASPIIPKTINQERKIYALRNQFKTSLADGAPNFEVIDYKGTVDELTDLPAAAEGLYGHVYLVINENNFYICQQNEGTEAWEWIFYAANIYDYEPDGATDEIPTEATTVGVEKYNAYLDLIPRIDFQGFWFGRTEDDEGDAGIILCFNHGVCQNKNGEDYPYGSSHNYMSDFTNVATFALTFECKEAGGTVDVGLYEKNWKRFLNLLNSQEEAEVTLYLSKADYMNLKFSDQLVIRNTKWFIKTMKPSIPYKGQVVLSLVRI